MRWNLTIYFSRTCYLQFLRCNHTHYFSRTFLRPQKRSKRAAVAAATRKMTGGGCGGQGMRPLLCSRMRLAPALALKTRFAIERFAPFEGQILSSKRRAHAAPALCKNTLVCLVRSGASVVRTKRSGALLSAHLAAPYLRISQAKFGVCRPSAHLKSEFAGQVHT